MSSSVFDDEGLDEKILVKLQTLSTAFFGSLNGDSSTLETFDRNWTLFSQSLSSCSNKLQIETLNVIYAFASTVTAVASGLLDLQSTSDGICNQFTSEVDDILSNDVDKLLLDDEHNTGNTESSTYIELSYRWLLANLHNPYPSTQVRAKISNESGTLRKDIDSWFIDARRRIGWNTLRKKRFGNKRASIIDAATRFFVSCDSKNPLDLSSESDFAAVQARAQDLYSAKFTESALASKLDYVVKDMTPEMKVKIKEAKRRQQLNKAKKATTHSSMYPTPDRSPGSSPQPFSPSPSSSCISLSSDVPREDSQADRKRCHSVIQELSDSNSEDVSRRPGKRHRMHPASSILGDPVAASISPPSPPISTCEDSEESVIAILSLNTSSLPSFSASISKRKRRTSDANTYPASKRPHTLGSSPVSSIASLDQYLPEVFASTSLVNSDIPDPVSVDAPDSTSTLEIEVFNFSSGGANLCSQASDITLADFKWPDIPVPAFDGCLQVGTVSSNELLYDSTAYNWCTPSDFDLIDSQSQSTALTFDFNELDAVGQCSATSTIPSRETSHSTRSLSQGPPNFWPGSGYPTPSPCFETSNDTDFGSVVMPSFSQSTGVYFPFNFLKQHGDKARELVKLEAKLLAIRAEIAAVS